MRVVVTGGAGFIGANLVQELVSHDISVVVVDDLSSGSTTNLEGLPGVRLLERSVTDLDAMEEACAGADAVVHLAARPSVPGSIEDPVACHEVNTSGTVTVLEAARRAGGLHVIAASSSAVYGVDPPLPTPEAVAPAPASPYAASKIATEGYVLAYGASFGVPALVFRLFNVFGPLQPAGHAYAAVIPAFVSSALAGRPLTVHGDGKQSRDFTYVGSVTAVLTDALLRGVTSPDPVNLAFGAHLDLLDLVSELESVLGHRIDVVHSDPRPGDVRRSQADQGRLRELFPDVEPVDFTRGLRQTVSWWQTLPR